MGAACTGTLGDLLDDPDPPVAGRWLSGRGHLHLIGVEMVLWHSGDISKFGKRRRVNGSVEYFTELNGQTYTAKLDAEGDLVWCDGDRWKRDVRAVETGTYAAINDVFSRANESLRALSTSTSTLAAPWAAALSTNTVLPVEECVSLAGDERTPATSYAIVSAQLASAKATARSQSASPTANQAASSRTVPNLEVVAPVFRTVGNLEHFTPPQEPAPTYRSRSASPHPGNATSRKNRFAMPTMFRTDRGVLLGAPRDATSPRAGSPQLRGAGGDKYGFDFAASRGAGLLQSGSPRLRGGGGGYGLDLSSLGDAGSPHSGSPQLRGGAGGCRSDLSALGGADSPHSGSPQVRGFAGGCRSDLSALEGAGSPHSGSPRLRGAAGGGVSEHGGSPQPHGEAGEYGYGTDFDDADAEPPSSSEDAQAPAAAGTVNSGRLIVPRPKRRVVGPAPTPRGEGSSRVAPGPASAPYEPTDR